MYLSLSEALKCYIRDTSWIMREIHSNTYDWYIQIHMLDALSRHPVKSGLTRGIVYLLRIQCGINVFLRISSAAWYRLAKYIMTQEWGWSTRGPLVFRCIMNVFCMYLDLASTACMEVWWYMDHTWIMYGSHNTPKLVGYVWDTS